MFRTPMLLGLARVLVPLPRIQLYCQTKSELYSRILPFFILGHRCHCRTFPLKPLAARFGS